MNKTYQFIAVFNKEAKGYNIWFPDLEECYSCAHQVREIPALAQEVLGLCLYSREEDGEKIPTPTPLDKIKLNKGETLLLVSCNTLLVREKITNAKTKKTLTIPTWLNSQAEAAGINFSQTLQDALKEKLG